MSERETVQHVAIARVDKDRVVREIFGDQQRVAAGAFHHRQSSGIRTYFVRQERYFAP